VTPLDPPRADEAIRQAERPDFLDGIFRLSSLSPFLVLLLVIVSLGAIRPATWTQFIMGTVCALLIATALTISIPHLYPWVPPIQNKPN
jgi:hypothetical protein